VHRHAVSGTDVTVLSQRLPLRLAKQWLRGGQLGRCRCCRIAPGALLRPGPPRNRTGTFQRIRLEQAVEIRWRNAIRSARKTGACRPQVRSPRRWPRRLTCPLVPASSSSLLVGSPDRVSALSRRTTGVRVRPVMRDGQLEGLAMTSRFPVAFPLPAFASRSSDARRGAGLSSRSAYRTCDHVRTSTGLPLSARSSCGRGGCLLYPEDGGAPPSRGTCPAGACRSSAASPSTPVPPSHPREALSYEASVGGLGSSPGKPGTSLCPAPLRTGRAPFDASGSSKPRRLAGGQKRRSLATASIALTVAVGVYETGCGLVRRTGLPHGDLSDRLAGGGQPLLPLTRALRLIVDGQEPTENDGLNWPHCDVGGFQLTLQHQRGFGGCNAGQEADAGGWGSG